MIYQSFTNSTSNSHNINVGGKTESKCVIMVGPLVDDYDNISNIKVVTVDEETPPSNNENPKRQMITMQ